MAKATASKAATSKATEADADGMYPYIPQDRESQLQMKVLMAFIEAGIPIGYVSDPGRGKTATIQAVARTMGRELINLSLSTLPAEDVSGIPSVVRQKVGENGETEIAHTEYAMPGWQLRILNNPNSILFLDEMSTAMPSTQHAFLQIIQDRRFPGSPVPFSKKVAIIVAMNPAAQAGGSSLDAPIANRFGWFPFKMPYASWLDGFMNEWKSDKPMPMPAIITDEKRKARNSHAFRSVVKSYLNSEGHRQTNLMPDPADDVSNIQEQDSDDAEANAEISQLAYMTNRSWENLAQVAKCFKGNDYEAIAMAARGLIGAKNSTKFMAYYKQNAAGLDLEEVLDDPKSIDWKDVSIDQSAALFQGLINLAKEGHWCEVMDVYFAIWDSGAKDLMSGNRVQDMWHADYMRSANISPDTVMRYKSEYLKRFGGILKASVK